jgi:thioredoxin reductase
VYQYPRGKIVMTQPAELPLVGALKTNLTSKEELLLFWRSIETKVGLKIRYRERVEAVVKNGSGFIVRSSQGEVRTQSVLLAVGRRGTPRKLEVPGESLPKVVYRLIEPEQYTGRRVLVVGGGDSALEAAASVAEAGARETALSYRGDAFQRAKQRNRTRVSAAQRNGSLRVLLKSRVTSIAPDHVVLEASGTPMKVGNDAVIVNAGGILPDDFLRSIGIDVVTKWGQA